MRVSRCFRRFAHVQKWAGSSRTPPLETIQSTAFLAKSKNPSLNSLSSGVSFGVSDLRLFLVLSDSDFSVLARFEAVFSPSETRSLPLTSLCASGAETCVTSVCAINTAAITFRHDFRRLVLFLLSSVIGFSF